MTTKGLLLEILNTWEEPALTEYVNHLKKQRDELSVLIEEVRKIRNSKIKKTPPDNGPRVG